MEDQTEHDEISGFNLKLSHGMSRWKIPTSMTLYRPMLHQLPHTNGAPPAVLTLQLHPLTKVKPENFLN